MPWFPDFANAAELARRQRQAAGRVDPGGAYVHALDSRRVEDLEAIWPDEVVVHDPVAGEIRGHRALRLFVRRSGRWLAEHRARSEPVACTVAAGRAVLELTAHLDAGGLPVAWPVAIVAEADGERSIRFRTYCSRWPVDGRHHVRPPLLAHAHARPPGVVGRLVEALATGDAEAAVGVFAPAGYLREPDAAEHHGLHSYFARCFRGGGSILLGIGATTDDGTRCALEYTCSRWGNRDQPPQAGLAFCERDADDRVAVVRFYDDIERAAAA